MVKGTELSRGMVVERERVGDGVNSTLYRRVPRTFPFIPPPPGCNPLDELKSTLPTSLSAGDVFFPSLSRPLSISLNLPLSTIVLPTVGCQPFEDEWMDSPLKQ